MSLRRSQPIASTFPTLLVLILVQLFARSGGKLHGLSLSVKRIHAVHMVEPARGQMLGQGWENVLKGGLVAILSVGHPRQGPRAD